MTRMKCSMRVMSSALLGLSAVTLLMGVLLTPNVVVANDEIVNGFSPLIAPCTGCAGGCPNKPRPCSGTQANCTQTGSSCISCGCEENAAKPGFCICNP